MMKKFLSNKKNAVLAAVALVQIFLLLVMTGYSWIESTFAVNIIGENLSFQDAVYSTANMDMYNPWNNTMYSTSSDTSHQIDLNKYIEERLSNPSNTAVGDKFMFAETSSANGKDFFFQKAGQRNASGAKYRAGNIDDVNTNYISFDFYMHANYSTKLWFDNSANSTPSFTYDGQDCKAIRMAFCVEDEDPIIFTNDPNTATFHQIPSNQTNAISSVNSAGDATKVVQQAHKFSEYTFNPETAAENTTTHVGKHLISLKKGETKKITIKIWLEQNHHELTQSNNPYGGKDLNMRLRFCSSWNKTVNIKVYDKTQEREAGAEISGPWIAKNGGPQIRAGLAGFGDGSNANDWTELSRTSNIEYTNNVWVGVADNINVIRWGGSSILNEFKPYEGTWGGERGSNTQFHIIASGYGVWGKEGTKEEAAKDSKNVFYMRTVDVYLTNGIKGMDASNDANGFWSNILRNPGNNGRFTYRIDDFLDKNAAAVIDMKCVSSTHYQVSLPSFIYKGSIMHLPDSSYDNTKHTISYSSVYQFWSDRNTTRTDKQREDSVIRLGSGGLSDTNPGAMMWYRELTGGVDISFNKYDCTWVNGSNGTMVAYDCSTDGDTGIIYAMTTTDSTVWTVKMYGGYTETNPTTGEITHSATRSGPTHVGFYRFYNSTSNWLYGGANWNTESERNPADSVMYYAYIDPNHVNTPKGVWKLPTTTTVPGTTTVPPTTTSTDPDLKFYVAGDTGLSPKGWDSMGVQMTLTGTGTNTLIYTATFTSVSSGTYGYKITNGAWEANGGTTWNHEGNAAGKGNAPANVATTGSTVVITFYYNTSNPNSSYCEATIAKAFYVAGVSSLVGGVGWELTGRLMTPTGANTYTATFTNVPVGNHNYKITDGTWSNTWNNEGFDTIGGQNAAVNVTTLGSTVTITFYYNPGNVNASYCSASVSSP